jgi:hypothetical protein
MALLSPPQPLLQPPLLPRLQTAREEETLPLKKRML